MKQLKSFFILLCFLGVKPSHLHAETNHVPTVPKSFDDLSTSDPTPDLLPSLFLYSLYNKGYAGGKTGLCVDFSSHNGQTLIKIGMTDSAFASGKDSLDPEKADEYSRNLKGLFNALSAAQGGSKVAIESIDGYADGQHLSTSGGNQDLAKRRAQTVASLFDSSDPVSLPSDDHQNGLNSPHLEALPESKRSCITRRKVVINIKVPASKVENLKTGVINLVPSPVSEALGAYNRRMVGAQLDAAQTAAENELDYPKDENGQARKIYAQAVKQGSISKACDQFPLKQMTLALIKNSIDNPVDSFEFSEGNGVVKEGNAFFLRSDDGTQKIPIRQNFSLRSTSAPTVAFACFKPTPKWDASNNLIDGKVLNASDGQKGLRADANVKMGFDCSLMKEEDVPGGFGSSHSDKKSRGFFCKKCGFGFFFDVTKSCTPMYEDRAIETKNKSADDPLVQALSKLKQADPLTLASSLTPTLFVVPNCGGCKCNPLAKVRGMNSSQNNGILTIDPLSTNGMSVSLQKQALDDSCTVSVPVWHTCGVAPNAVASAVGSDFKNSLYYFDPVSGESYDGFKDLNELLGRMNKGKNSCPDSVLSPQEKVNSVSCSGDPSRVLPSQDEADGCPALSK